MISRYRKTITHPKKFKQGIKSTDGWYGPSTIAHLSIAQMVERLDQYADAARGTDRTRTIAFLRRCPDSHYNQGYPQGYVGPSRTEIENHLLDALND